MFERPSICRIAAVLLVPTFSSLAHAEPSSRPAPAASAAPASPPAATATPPAPAATPALDLVLLKNGGMIRGTISEMVPGESVTILTVGGTTKKIPMAEVKYAGPADKAPKAQEKDDSTASDESNPETPRSDGTRPFITVRSKPVAFKFISSDPGVTLHIKTGEAEAVGPMGMPTGITAVGYTPICTAPCLAALPAGSHQFALSKDGGSAIATPSLTSLSERSTIEGIYQSRQGTRTAGWVIGVGGVATALVLIATGMQSHTTTCAANDYACVPNTESNLNNLYLGMGIGLVSTFVAMFMVRARDGADVTVSRRTAD
jgi:hypothetical protein